MLARAQTPVAISAPPAANEYSSAHAGRVAATRPGREQQQAGERVDAVEVDPEDGLGRGVVAEVEARLGEEPGERPAELEDADRQHPLLQQGPGAAEAASRRTGGGAACSVIGSPFFGRRWGIT